MYSRIVTHDDFDGIISAAICAHVLKVDTFFFTGPGAIERAAVSTSEEDVVCDLPCPALCGLWFDHHTGNRESLSYRQIDPESIPGAFAPEKSCARVIFNHFSASAPLPERFTEMADQADIIDSFGYGNIEEWRRETPASIIDGAIKYRGGSRNGRLRLLSRLVSALSKRPLPDVSREAWIAEPYAAFKQEEAAALEQIDNDASFHGTDTEKEIVVLDRTRHNRQDPIQKNLAYIVYPDSLAVLEIKNRFRRGVKTNDLAFSMSLGLKAEKSRNIGEIMRNLNIGDGHPGAGAGTIDCANKNEMLKTKDATVTEILNLWRSMANG